MFHTTTYQLRYFLHAGLFVCLFLGISCTPTTKTTSSTDNASEESMGNESVALFDGKTLTGWEGPQDFFRIEEEAIVAGSLVEQIPTNLFMCTEKSYGDFEMTLQVKFQPYKNNGGIQIRSKRIPDHHEVIGYQVDVGYSGDQPVWASLYDESRRNKFMEEAPADRIQALLKKDSYNAYKIRCQGAKVAVWFNGEQVIDYTEEDDSIDRSGIICVQIHGGSPAEAWYKDIRIKEL